MRTPPTPRNLQRAGKSFWKKTHGEFKLSDTWQLELLTLCCQALDGIEEAQKALAEDGRYIDGRYSKIAHPAAKDLKDFTTIFYRTIRELGLNLEGSKESTRPPSLY